ncbi:GntR family transcriptional regulator [soil metagenome]
MESLEPVYRETTAGIIADRIRVAVMDGTFAPGVQLGEAQLAASLEVSRGPVREAMQRLIQEGLLRNERHRGVFVIEFDEGDIADIYLARGAAEQTAARLLTRRADTAAFDLLDGLLSQMAAVVSSGDWSKVADLDMRFHEALIAATGSKRLIRMYRTLLSEMRICLTPLEGAYPRREEVVDEHREIVAAMRAGDQQRVMDLVDGHFGHAVRELTARLATPTDDP